MLLHISPSSPFIVDVEPSVLLAIVHQDGKLGGRNTTWDALSNSTKEKKFGKKKQQLFWLFLLLVFFFVFLGG
jgi:hypothetical protein